MYKTAEINTHTQGFSEMATVISATFQKKLENAFDVNDSWLCVGLDPDRNLIEDDKIVELNMAIVDATAGLACAYKPNLAIYESLGKDGHSVLERTLDYIRDRSPLTPIIGDAKRGDIGLCGNAYADTILDYGFDAVTVNPYMGSDALGPFLENEELGVFILCKTSNPSGVELQDLRLDSGKLLYERVAELAETQWNVNDNVGLVVGATYPDEIRRVRSICPQMPFLIPGVGAQGGDIRDTVSSAMNSDGSGFVINVSRQIMYSGAGPEGNLEFDTSARRRMRDTALKIGDQINRQVGIARESEMASVELSTNED